MKKNFKKTLAVFMSVLMLLSVVSVSVFAATYRITFNPGSSANEKDLVQTITVDGKQTITLPGALYTRDGYYQAGWSVAKAGTRKTADLGAPYNVTKNQNFYPYWEAVKFTVSFVPGAGCEGEQLDVPVDYNKTTKFPGAIFTREGYVQIGWTSVEGGEKEYEFGETTSKILNDTVFYPVWIKSDFTVETNLEKIKFGNVCIDYSVPDAKFFTITNKGNMNLSYTLPTDDSFNVSVSTGSLVVMPGETVSFKIQPKSGLGVDDYSTTLVFDCIYDSADVTVDVMFIVNEHSFDKYYSDNNATYEADGTKSAECSNGCGRVDTIIDLGSMKIYDAKYNTVDGLLKEYLYHKTIRVTAYGSGTDNIQADGTIAEGTKRYLPVSWYVNDEFNGEFTEDNFDINFVHTSFGKYTLKVSYVEQEYVNGEWVNTENTDEKSFDYYVGPSEKEEQEVVRPNMIVSIIFALFAKVAELFGGLFG